MRISTAKADANNKAGAIAGRFHTGSGTAREIILAVIPETKCDNVSTRQKGFSKAENHINFLFQAENFQNEIIRALYTAPVINFSII